MTTYYSVPFPNILKDSKSRCAPQRWLKAPTLMLWDNYYRKEKELGKNKINSYTVKYSQILPDIWNTWCLLEGWKIHGIWKIKYVMYNTDHLHKAYQFPLDKAFMGHTTLLISYLVQNVCVTTRGLNLWDFKEENTGSLSSTHHPVPKLLLRWQDVWWGLGYEAKEMVRP